MQWINKLIDRFLAQVERLSIWRWHILFMFIGLGLYLIVLPLLHVIVVSLNIETELGNYTNVISAGVSLLTLAEAKRISEGQNNHIKEVKKIHSKLDKITKDKK